MTDAPRLALIGTGPVATAVAVAYARGGGRVEVIVSRDRARADALAGRCGARGATDAADALRAEAVLVCVADRAVADTGRRLLAAGAAAEPPVLHTSGALSGDELGGPPLTAGSLHPLQSFPAGLAADALADRIAAVHWFHEGRGEAAAERIVGVLGGTLHRLAPGGKAAYHAGAAVLSNHAVALFDAATRLFAAAGVPPAESREPLAVLLAGTTANLRAEGAVRALTGPVARGDADTVRRHLRAISESEPGLLESYAALARCALALGRRKGTLGDAAAEEIERALAHSRRSTSTAGGGSSG